MKHKLAPGKQQKLQSSKSKTQTRRNWITKKKLKSKRSAPHRCNSSSSNIGGSSRKITITKWNNRVNGSRGVGHRGKGVKTRAWHPAVLASCRTTIPASWWLVALHQSRKLCAGKCILLVACILYAKWQQWKFFVANSNGTTATPPNGLPKRNWKAKMMKMCEMKRVACNSNGNRSCSTRSNGSSIWLVGCASTPADNFDFQSAQIGNGKANFQLVAAASRSSAQH